MAVRYTVILLLHKYIYQGIRENRIMSIAKDIKAYIAEQFTTTRRKDFSLTDENGVAPICEAD